MWHEARDVTNACSYGRPLVVGFWLRECHGETSRWPLLGVCLGSKGSRQRSMHGVLGGLHQFPYIC